MSCQACQTSIEGSGVTALGKSFHKACFVCEGCHRGFDKGRFAVGDDEKPYHEECLGDKDTPVSSSTPCDECGKAIGEGHILRTGGKLWHRDCVKCAVCSKEIRGNLETLGDGRLVHEACAPASQCFICKQTIDSELVVLPNGNEACSQCFTCAKCGEQFNDAFVEENDYYYHSACAPTPELDPCAACGKEVSDPAVRVEDALYCAGCFVCATCRKPFESVYTKDNGKYYHKECAAE